MAPKGVSTSQNLCVQTASAARRPGFLLAYVKRGKVKSCPGQAKGNRDCPQGDHVVTLASPERVVGMD